MDEKKLKKELNKKKRKEFISGLVKDERGKPSATKIQSWGSWLAVMAAWMFDVIQHGFRESIEFALALLGIAVGARGVSKVTNLRNKSDKPTKSLFKSKPKDAA